MACFVFESMRGALPRPGCTAMEQRLKQARHDANHIVIKAGDGD